MLVHSQINNKSEIVVLEAIKAMLKYHFARHEPKIDLFFYGYKSELLANDLLREKTPEVSVRVIRIDTASKVPINSLSIVLIESGEAYLSK
jgi:hypothetical protein